MRLALLDQCAGDVNRLETAGGRRIYVSAEHGERIYFLERGKVGIGRASAAGKFIIFRLVRPGQLFGETAVVGEGRRREEARALEDCVCLSVPAFRVRQCLAADQDLAAKFLELLGGRLIETRQRFFDLASETVTRRLAKILLEEARHRGIRRDGGIRLRLGLTHEQLGQIVGTSREMVTATLVSLRHQGLLDYRNGSYTLLEEKVDRFLLGGEETAADLKNRG